MLRKNAKWMLVLGLSIATTAWLGCTAAPAGGGGGANTDDGMDDGTGDGAGGDEDGSEDGEGGGGNGGPDGAGDGTGGGDTDANDDDAGDGMDQDDLPGGGTGDGGDSDTLPEGDSGPACATDEDCGVDGFCVDGGCVCLCESDGECPENSVCDGCICVEVDGGGGDDGGGNDGDPDPDALTFNNFAGDFFNNHCTFCHSAASQNRFGAPISINFDTYDEVLSLIDRIEFRAVTTATMPPASAPTEDLFPTDEERAMLGEWIAAGAPEN